MISARRAVLAGAALFVGCAGPYQTMQPTTRLSSSSPELRVEVDHVEVAATETVVALRATNLTRHELRFDPTEARLLTRAPVQPADASGDGSLVGSPVSGVVSTGSGAGSALSGGGGGGASAIVGLALAGTTLVIAIAVLAGVTVCAVGYVLIDDAIASARENLDPGESETFRVGFSGVHFGDTEDERVDVSRTTAFTLAPPPPVALVAPGVAHLGWGEPEPPSFAVGVRTGGGPLVRANDPDGAMGGFEIWAGPRYGPLVVAGYGVLGAGAFGGELQLHVETEHVAVLASAGYGFYWLVGGIGFAAGHGPRAGLEIDFALPNGVGPLDWPAPPLWLGVYAEGGPVFLANEEIGAALEVGLSMGVY